MWSLLQLFVPTTAAWKPPQIIHNWMSCVPTETYLQKQALGPWAIVSHKGWSSGDTREQNSATLVQSKSRFPFQFSRNLDYEEQKSLSLVLEGLQCVSHSCKSFNCKRTDLRLRTSQSVVSQLEFNNICFHSNYRHSYFRVTATDTFTKSYRFPLKKT